MNPIICPTVLAPDSAAYSKQIAKVANLSRRIQIDLTDSRFAPAETVKPSEAWWPAGVKADIHLMYKDPLLAIRQVIDHQPNLIIVHAESEISLAEAVRLCRDRSVACGVALLAATPVEQLKSIIREVDHVLIFSGDLGSFGGHADLSLLDKVKAVKELRPEIEVGWDGGINLRNVAELVAGGVDVLNVGGYIQNADDPAKAYADLARIAEETGTT